MFSFTGCCYSHVRSPDKETGRCLYENQSSEIPITPRQPAAGSQIFDKDKIRRYALMVPINFRRPEEETSLLRSDQRVHSYVYMDWWTQKVSKDESIIQNSNNSVSTETHTCGQKIVGKQP